MLNLWVKCLHILYKSANLTRVVKATENGLMWPKPQHAVSSTLRDEGSQQDTPFLKVLPWTLGAVCHTQPVLPSFFGPRTYLASLHSDDRQMCAQGMRRSPSQPVQWPIYIAHWDFCVSRNNDGKMIKTTQLKPFAEWQVSRILAVGSQRSFYFILTLSYMRWNWLGAQD